MIELDSILSAHLRGVPCCFLVHTHWSWLSTFQLRIKSRCKNIMRNFSHQSHGTENRLSVDLNELLYRRYVVDRSYRSIGTLDAMG